ncbi:uncharacterized protein L201_007035 [Kwoniella dendrophila CBS 6074]|uniref:SWI/SNF chromatin-remodeling complex subunit snf5 n=1 Tax=Kwoniella dendrophila CBS 6074 TaxID=1295534 RepID=A0AAX4K305_9TREE
MSTPNQGNSGSPALSNLGYPMTSNGMNFFPSNQQQQQQFMSNTDMSTSSPIPGASGGQGDPGPSSMAQQQQGQFRPQFPQGGITPQQMAMLQQFSQAAQSQNPQGQGQGQGQQGQPRQFTPQQMQLAMATMQAQQGGSSINPQALMAAMRASQQAQAQGMQGGMNQPQIPQQSQQSQQQPQQQQQRPSNQQMNSFSNPAQQSGVPPGQQVSNPAQIAFQQQRMQQMMQARPNPGSPIRPNQQQPNAMPPPPVPNTQQQQQQQQGNMANSQAQSPSVFQQTSNNPQGGFHLTQQQRDFLTNSRNSLFANPQFTALPPNQQQQIVVQQQQSILRQMTANQMPSTIPQVNQNQQQPQQPQQPMQQAQTPSGRPSSAHGTPGPGQSPRIARQPTPQQMGTPQSQQAHTPQSSHVQTPQHPLSSLPQHMAPPRPASAASQRAPSPHQGVPGLPGSPAMIPPPSSTPPPSSAMYSSSGQQMTNAPSPTPSNVSHHSQHQTPAFSHTQPPPHSVSPVHARSQTPSQPQQIGTPQSNQSVNQIGINGQYPGNQQFQPQLTQHQSQQQQQNIGTPQQGSQPFPPVFSGSNQSGPPNDSSTVQQASYPVQPIVPSLQNMTPAQQQQMASAMSFMSQAAQAQHTPSPNNAQQHVRPNQQAQGAPNTRPPHMPNINTSDFPFDPRLLPNIQHLKDEKWKAAMAAQNPQFLAAVQNAANVVPTLRHDIIQRMQNVLFHSAKIAAAAHAAQTNQSIQQSPHSQTIGRPPQQFDQAGLPGFSPITAQAGAPGPIPPNQQQRIWQAQQAAQAAQAQGSPASANSASPAIRPPPPHVIPQASNMPGSPSPRNVSLDRRTSGSGKDKSAKGEKTPQQASMPPPSFIPSHSPVGTSKPPPHISSDTSAQPPQTTISSARPPAVSAKTTVNGLPKEWENALRLDLPITTITPLPINDIDECEDSTFKGALLPMSELEKIQVKQWLEKDKEFVANERETQAKRINKMKKWAEENDKATPWWMLRKGEMRVKPSQRLRILWPTDKEKDRANRTHKGRKQIKFSPAQLKSMAQVEDQLVPVRLDLEHDNFRLKDTFMWNCSDKVVTPELFAQSLCDDFQVPAQHFLSRIVAAIQERVQEYQDQVLPIVQRLPKEDYKGKLDPEGDGEARAMFEIFRRVREGSGIEEEIKTDPGEEVNDEIKIVSLEDANGLGLDDVDEIPKFEDERPMTVEEAMEVLPKEENEELRILIKVDIIIGTQNLSDSFEWDLNSNITPEEFSASYVTELGLSKEFATALAHDIHEQILVHKRSLFLVGHAFGSGLILDDEVRLAFLPPVTTSLRKEDLAMASYTPIFNQLTEDQLALIEVQREKESKRKKRAGRARRGVVLPDRDPIKTQRSLLNPLGPNGLPVFSAPELIANTKDSAPLHRRRGAAIAAEANMALIAQDLPIGGPSSPAHHHRDHHHGPTISARGKRIGRPPKNLSRASPANFGNVATREGSILEPHPHQLSTPSLSHIGIKRSFREDSIDDFSANNSPALSRKRISHSRIPDSPELEPGQQIQVQTQRQTPIKHESYVNHNHNTNSHNGLQAIQEEKKRKLAHETSGDDSARRPSLGSNTPTGPIASQNTISTKALNPTTNLGNDNDDSNSDSDDSSVSDDDDESDSTFASSSRSKTSKRGRGRNGKKQRNVSSTSLTNKLPKIEDQTPIKPPPSSSYAVSAPHGRSPSTTINISPSSAKKNIIELPIWASRALSDLRAKYPRDDFVVVQKPRPVDAPPGGQIEWRAKCMDCPGRIYSLGPGETLQNFEVHLKNRAHIQNRVNREEKQH